MSTAVSRLASQPRYRKSPSIYKGMVLWNSQAESDIPSARTLSWDTGAPNHTAAEGSVYIRLDASDADLVFYRNTDGAATWETIVGSELTDLLAATNTWTAANTFSHASGVTSNVITERTAAAGVTVDGLLIKDGAVDLNGVAGALILDADADTHIGANTDDEIDITVNGAADFKILANILRCLSGSVLETNTVNETTAASGVTVDGLLIKDGLVRSNDFVKATVACADATGGATTALLSVQLYQADGTTAITAARQVLLILNAAEYSDAAGPTNASLTLGTVTAGSIVATVVVGSVYLIETSAAGLFGCTATNTDDETIYASAKTAVGGVSDITKACIVLGSNSESAAWSA